MTNVLEKTLRLNGKPLRIVLAMVKQMKMKDKLIEIFDTQEDIALDPIWHGYYDWYIRGV